MLDPPPTDSLAILLLTDWIIWINLISINDEISVGQNAELFGKLDDMLVAKRLLLMSSLFQGCSDWVDAFHAGQMCRQLQQDWLVDRFQKMASSWMAQFLQGVTLFCIAQLCDRLTERGSVRTEKCDSMEDVFQNEDSLRSSEEKVVMDQAVELIGSVESCWRKCERFKLMHQHQEMDRALVQLLQQQVTAHSWIHEASVTSNINSTCVPSGVFVTQFRQALSVLLSQSPQLTDVHQQVTHLAAQVEQRLRWASGANPNLQKVNNFFLVFSFLFFDQLQLIISLTLVDERIQGRSR